MDAVSRALDVSRSDLACPTCRPVTLRRTWVNRDVQIFIRTNVLDKEVSQPVASTDDQLTCTGRVHQLLPLSRTLTGKTPDEVHVLVPQSNQRTLLVRRDDE